MYCAGASEISSVIQKGPPPPLDLYVDVRPERPQNADKHLSHPSENTNRTCAVTDLPTQQKAQREMYGRMRNGLPIFRNKT